MENYLQEKEILKITKTFYLSCPLCWFLMLEVVSSNSFPNTFFMFTMWIVFVHQFLE